LAAFLDFISVRKDIERVTKSRKGITKMKLVNVTLDEPPSCSCTSTIVFIGRNRRGQWVAQQQNGLYGGLFVNRAQAVKYALFENGHHPETVVELSREFELDMNSGPSVAPPPLTAAQRVA
jgi:hypothetical protein